jgi:hypothetical protein
MQRENARIGAQCRRISAIRSSPIQPRPDRVPITHKWRWIRERLPALGVGLHLEMERRMNNLKVLSMASALVLAVAMPSASFAQFKGGHGGGGGARMGGGGGVHMGGGGAFRGGKAGGNIRGGMGGGNFRAGPAVAGGAAFAGARSPAYVGGAQRAYVGGGQRVAGGNWNGGNNWNGGYRHRRGGFWPGVGVGVGLGIASGYGYGAGYYDPYYDNSYAYYNDDSGYYDDSGSVAVVPGGGGDDAGYCAQRYRSYDPASGTYLGYDGQRHPCP